MKYQQQHHLQDKIDKIKTVCLYLAKPGAEIILRFSKKINGEHPTMWASARKHDLFQTGIMMTNEHKTIIVDQLSANCCV